MLPNFLIIGAMRSGTTALFHHLRSHPEVFGARQKELRFFDVQYDRGVDWYAANFAEGLRAVATGEASQTYMYDRLAVERMARVVPEARLIAILRDPVERAYSHYWLNRSLGREPLDFQSALQIEEERLHRGDVRDRFRYSYIDRGRYVHQLTHVCTHYDRSRLLVLLFDDLRDDPLGTYSLVCRFLEIDNRFTPKDLGKRVNAFQQFRSQWVRGFTLRLERSGNAFGARLLGSLNRLRSNYPPMPPDTRAWLDEVFRPHNEALSIWLGRDLGVWTEIVARPTR